MIHFTLPKCEYVIRKPGEIFRPSLPIYVGLCTQAANISSRNRIRYGEKSFNKFKLVLSFKPLSMCFIHQTKPLLPVRIYQLV